MQIDRLEGKTIGYNLRVHVIAQQLFAPEHVVAQRERSTFSCRRADNIEPRDYY